MLIFCISDSSPFPSSIPHTFQINFNSLYTALCEQQTSDQATLLLYTLLHQNSNVRTYMLARTDMENLVSLKASMPGKCWRIAEGCVLSQEGQSVPLMAIQVVLERLMGDVPRLR